MNGIICYHVQNIWWSHIEYLGITDLNETDFTDEEIELYLKQKPYLEGTCLNDDIIIFNSSSKDDLTEEEDSFIDEPCFFNEINNQHYMQNWHKLKNKYEKHSSIDLSKEKLDFPEVITVFTFVERANRHAGQGSPNDQEVWLNLLKRLEEIKNELIY